MERIARYRAWIAIGLAGLLLGTGFARAQTRRRTPPAHSMSRACGRFLHPDGHGAFLASEDVRPPLAPVDGNDLLALVDRSPRYVLAPDYAPADLVDVRTLAATPPIACRPPDHQCLRREAALALRRMLAAMRGAHQDGYIDSAYRGYSVQCDVFQMWAYRDHHGFCSATEFSALPGHSQHQLGTVVDLFTRAWVYGGDRFRDGFGCSPGGRWIAEHAWEYGFVLPYPLHPDYAEAGSTCAARASERGRVDPRTGYKYEPWHVRYIGVASAAQFHDAWRASGPGSADEITLEQWLRARAGIASPIDAPVCDGCSCETCATFHRDDDASERSRSAGPCRTPAIVLGSDGEPIVATSPPTLIDANVERIDDHTIRVRAVVDIPAHTLTQPPIVRPGDDVRFGDTRDIGRFVAVSNGVAHAYPVLPNSWRLMVAPHGDARLPRWQIALVDEHADLAQNGVNARIPASIGRTALELRIAGLRAGTAIDVALVRNEERVGARTFTLR